jgi:hypothetical protein
MSILGRSANGFFGSETLSGHLLRGGVAAALFGWAIARQETHPLEAFSAGAAALVALRGCPVCWSIGLVETARNAWQRRARRMDTQPDS